MLTPQRARDTLDKWGRNNAMRDKVVVSAYRAGISKREIHQRTGIARTTIDRIIARLVPLELFPPRAVPGFVSRETSAVEMSQAGAEDADGAEHGDSEPVCPAAAS